MRRNRAEGETSHASRRAQDGYSPEAAVGPDNVPKGLFQPPEDGVPPLSADNGDQGDQGD
ncbi:hypothetical protein [Candidatus Poriferisodalis sp.]|uniref:hypothetical protein n=1 Tax=Candidatus Poriferisodalis sp. TaxID=3101277 RepID=UPI003B593D8F